jgi:hypothetical protein
MKKEAQFWTAQTQRQEENIQEKLLKHQSSKDP